MRLARHITAALALSLLLACTGSKATELDDVMGGAGAGAVPAASDAPATEPDDDAPHALATVVLGESHASKGASKAMVSVSFVPDAATAHAVHGKVIAGCELATAASANGGAGAATDGESFDGGPVAISGASTPMTLFPPYDWDAAEEGVPFAPGSKLEVRAEGAAGAGFEKFDETFTATQMIVTSPPLATLPHASIFGTGSLPITWLAGSDSIVVTASGAGGTLRCNADDATGHFELPREVVKTALGNAKSLVLSVARVRNDVKKGKKTKGTLEGATVQPVGWLSLTTTSVETASFECSGTECTGGPVAGCQDCRTSMCKTEFDACTADATCPFLRTCLDACTTTSCRNTCFTKWPEASAKAKNGALYKCQCIAKCAVECVAECK